MSLPLAIVIVVVAVGGVSLLFILVHRSIGKPLLHNPSRGTGMSSVAGTSFAVLLAFVILAAFQTYSGARSGAQSEAEAVLDMARTAALFPRAQSRALRSDLLCYGRAVIAKEWPAMRDGHSSPVVDDWIEAYRAEFARLDLNSPRRQLAFQEILNQAASRTAGRQQRLSDDTPAVPTPLWIVLIFGGAVGVAIQFGQADPSERRSVQTFMVAGVAAIVVAGLLVVYFLDHPYQNELGGIQPTAMRQTLSTIHGLEPGLRPPCTVTGTPLAS